MAEVNPDFKKWLESGTKSVVWLQLGTALAAIAVPIAAHHKLIPIDDKGAYQLFHGKLPAGMNKQNAPETVTVDQDPVEQALNDESAP
jgi:hypothetical protein